MRISTWAALLAAISQASALPVDGSKTSESQQLTAVDVSPLILASAEHELAKRANLFAASALCVSRRCMSPTERAKHTDNATDRLHILLHDQVWHLF
jgi:hypothetical protein